MSFDSHIKTQLEQIKSLGIAKEAVAVSAKGPASLVLKGNKLCDFTSWDFFNLSSNHAFKRAAQGSIESNGISSGAARLVSGSLKTHDICEQRIANFFGFQAALLFSSRNQASLSLVTSLCEQGDLVLYDQHMTAPVSDAAYLAEVANISYSINELSTLEAELQKSKFYQNRFIFAETLSALTGSTIAVDPLINLARNYQAILVLDESYALAAKGLRGSGVSEQHRLNEELAIVFADLSLGLACYGAAITSSNAVCELILNRSKTFVNEAAFPACIAASVVAAIDQVELQHVAREKLRQLSEHVAGVLEKMGLQVLSSESGPVIVLATETARKAFALQEALFQKGFLVEATLPKETRSERASVRLVMNHAHKEADIERLIKAIDAVRSHVGV